MSACVWPVLSVSDSKLQACEAVMVMALSRPSSECHVSLPAELSHSSWLNLMASIPAERYLSLELPTGLTSWTLLCSGRAGMSRPTLPCSGVGLLSTLASGELDCVPTRALSGGLPPSLSSWL